jgi:hypothetical protein
MKKSRSLIKRRVAKGAGIVDYITNVFSKNKDFTNSTKKVLKKYGDLPITGLQIMRAPIISAIDSALNIISLGSWAKLKKDNSFDSLFHLFSVITVALPNGNRKNILVEKNQSINVSESIPNRTRDTDVITIAWNSNKTINQMLETTLKAVGPDRFFVYRPFNDNNNGGNCQRFITDVLDSNGLLGPRYASWILQDVEPLVKGLPNYVLKFSKGVTDFAAGAEKLIGGKKRKGTQKQYIELVKIIASSYGYNPKTIRLAKDGKHKIIITHNNKNIKFGKHGSDDYITLFLSGNEGEAVKKRKAYLTRSGKIKGDWKNDIYSKNNLARNILWMAPVMKGGSNTKEVQGNSISDVELKKYLPDAKILMYPDLKHYETIEQVLPNNKSYAIILYLESEGSGHWISIKRMRKSIQVFCSYGTPVDGQLEWYPMAIREQLDEVTPYLSNLLNKTKLNVVYNDVDYQKDRGNNKIATCGRHVIYNIQKFLNDDMDLDKYYKHMKALQKKDKKSFDEIVSSKIDLILD